MKRRSPSCRWWMMRKAHKSYVWVYASTQYNPVYVVIYDFQDSRSGQHAEEFLNGWQGHLVCDDSSGYKARFKSGQVIEVGCMVHARRKFHELHVTRKSQIEEQALRLIQKLYAIEVELIKKTNATGQPPKILATVQSTDHATTI